MEISKEVCPKCLFYHVRRKGRGKGETPVQWKYILPSWLQIERRQTFKSLLQCTFEINRRTVQIHFSRLIEHSQSFFFFFFSFTKAVLSLIFESSQNVLCKSSAFPAFKEKGYWTPLWRKVFLKFMFIPFFPLDFYLCMWVHWSTCAAKREHALTSLIPPDHTGAESCVKWQQILISHCPCQYSKITAKLCISGLPL